MRLRHGILGPRQQRVLRQLGPVLTRQHFYLGGGTALALQMGHRRSVDLDWFSARRIPNPARLGQRLRDEGTGFVMEQVEKGTLHGRVSGVRVTLLEYRYPLLRPAVPAPAFGCDLASLEDLAAMKLSAVADRGAKKDFLDLFALATRHAALGQMLAWYREKYATEDIAHVLYSLIWFQDADRQRMPPMLRKTDWRAVKKAMRLWVAEITNPPR